MSNACYGDMYEGDYQDGEVNRKGTCVWANSNIYEGDWKDDKRNGKTTRGVESSLETFLLISLLKTMMTLFLERIFFVAE